MSLFSRLRNLWELSKLESKINPKNKMANFWPSKVKNKPHMTMAELLQKTNPRLAKIIEDRPIDNFPSDEDLDEALRNLKEEA